MEPIGGAPPADRNASPRPVCQPSLLANMPVPVESPARLPTDRRAPTGRREGLRQSGLLGIAQARAALAEAIRRSESRAQTWAA
jgi:hypothetical protein